MIAYDLYGAKTLTLLLAREHIEGILGVSLDERNSTYQGGVYYMLGSNESENFILKVNLDPFDDEPVEQNFPDYPVLLYINATARSSDVEEAIKKGACFKLLRHEVF